MVFNLVETSVSKTFFVKFYLKFIFPVLYKSGPQFYHATYIVYIKNSNEEFDSLHFQGLSRIAETSAKDLLVIEVFYPKNVSSTNYEQCFDNLSSFKISEYSPKRFLYNQAK